MPSRTYRLPALAKTTIAPAATAPQPAAAVAGQRHQREQQYLEDFRRHPKRSSLDALHARSSARDSLKVVRMPVAEPTDDRIRAFKLFQT